MGRGREGRTKYEVPSLRDVRYGFVAPLGDINFST